MIPLAVVFPENPEDQVAFQSASEVRILPIHGFPHLTRRLPERSRVVDGVMVPIPTFPHQAIGLLFASTHGLI